MKLLGLILGLVVASSAMAGGSSLTCSTADGSITIAEDGAKTVVNGKTYNAVLALESIGGIGTADASVEAYVLPVNSKQIIKSLSYKAGCRDVSETVFVQSIYVVAGTPKRFAGSGIVICELNQTSTMGGLDNPECANQ